MRRKLLIKYVAIYLTFRNCLCSFRIGRRLQHNSFIPANCKDLICFCTVPSESTLQTPRPSSTPNQAQEAAQAHHEALQTLSFLESSPAQSTSSTIPRSLLSSFVGSFLPVSNQRGPIASALRIVHRLRQQSWIPRPILFFLNLGGPGPHHSRSDEELNETAIKILDLLEHAIELGDVDALYTMGRVSLVG